MLRKTKSIFFSALGVALVLGMLTPAVQAQALLDGTLYYTTLGPVSMATGLACTFPPGAGCFNVWSVHFTYSAGTPPTVVLGPRTGIVLLSGADGILLISGKLVVGEQFFNKVAIVDPVAKTFTEVASDGSNVHGQAYALTAKPDNSAVITFPNDGLGNTDWTGNKITIVPLSPSFLAGTAVTITGSEGASTEGLRAGAFDALGTTLYYGDALDFSLGHFGTLTLGGLTARLAVVDGTVGPPHPDVSSALPSHDVELDTLPGCFVLSSGNNIWDVCNVSGTWTVKSKLSNNPGGFSNWDQTRNDGLGHMFGANNDGKLMFLDYSGTANHFVGEANGGAPGGVVGSFLNVQQLSNLLDDIAFLPTAPNGCPATKGFWHIFDKHPWPSGIVTVDGVTYNGSASPPTMKIGGVTYTQAQLADILTENAKGGNGLIIGGSQLIAAVLNIANGSPKPAVVVTAIQDINTILKNAGQSLLTTNTLTDAQNAALIADGAILDTYNSSAGTLMCVEGTPGTF